LTYQRWEAGLVVVVPFLLVTVEVVIWRAETASLSVLLEARRKQATGFMESFTRMSTMVCGSGSERERDPPKWSSRWIRHLRAAWKAVMVRWAWRGDGEELVLMESSRMHSKRVSRSMAG